MNKKFKLLIVSLIFIPILTYLYHAIENQWGIETPQGFAWFGSYIGGVVGSIAALFTLVYIKKTYEVTVHELHHTSENMKTAAIHQEHLLKISKSSLDLERSNQQRSDLRESIAIELKHLREMQQIKLLSLSTSKQIFDESMKTGDHGVIDVASLTLPVKCTPYPMFHSMLANDQTLKELKTLRLSSLATYTSIKKLITEIQVGSPEQFSPAIIMFVIDIVITNLKLASSLFQYQRLGGERGYVSTVLHETKQDTLDVIGWAALIDLESSHFVNKTVAINLSVLFSNMFLSLRVRESRVDRRDNTIYERLRAELESKAKQYLESLDSDSQIKAREKLPEQLC